MGPNTMILSMQAAGWQQAITLPCLQGINLRQQPNASLIVRCFRDLSLGL